MTGRLHPTDPEEKNRVQLSRNIRRKLLLIASPVAVLVVAIILAVPNLLDRPSFPGLAFPSEEAFMNALMRDCSGMFPSSEFTEEQANEYLQTRGIRYPGTYCRPHEMPDEAELAYIEVTDEHILHAYAYDYNLKRDPYLQKAEPGQCVLFYCVTDSDFGTTYLEEDRSGSFEKDRRGLYIQDDHPEKICALWQETDKDWILAQFPRSIPMVQIARLCSANVVNSPVFNERMNGGLVILTDLVSWSDYADGPIHHTQVDLPVAGNEQPVNLIVDDDLNIWYQEESHQILFHNLESGSSETVWTAPDSVQIALCYADASYLVWTEYVPNPGPQEKEYRLSALDRTTGAIRTTPLEGFRVTPISITRHEDCLYFVKTQPVHALMEYNLQSGFLNTITNGSVTLYNYAHQLMWQKQVGYGADKHVVWFTIRDGKEHEYTEQELAATDLPLVTYEYSMDRLEWPSSTLILQQGEKAEPLAYEVLTSSRVYLSDWSVWEHTLALDMMCFAPNSWPIPFVYDLDRRVFIELDEEAFTEPVESWLDFISFGTGTLHMRSLQTDKYILFYTESRSDDAPYRLDLIWIDREDLP